MAVEAMAIDEAVLPVLAHPVAGCGCAAAEHVHPRTSSALTHATRHLLSC